MGSGGAGGGGSDPWQALSVHTRLVEVTGKEFLKGYEEQQ